MENIRNAACVLFDLDGTIHDPAHGILRCFDIGLKAVGAPPLDEKTARENIIGPPLAWSYTTLCGLDDETSDRAIEAYRAEYFTVGYKESVVYDGMTECLRALKSAGIKTGMATSKPEECAKDIARYHGFDKYLDVICGAKLTDKKSTKTQLILRAISELGITADGNVYMVGDKKYDIAGARAAGVTGIGVLYGFGSREELEEAGADMILGSPYEITEFFTGKGRRSE